jgi:hypothetical protein
MDQDQDQDQYAYGAKCNFCGRAFRNAQAVRRHLGYCRVYHAHRARTLPPGAPAVAPREVCQRCGFEIRPAHIRSWCELMQRMRVADPKQWEMHKQRDQLWGDDVVEE